MKYEEKLLISICKDDPINDIDYSRINWENFLIQSIVHKVFGKLHQFFLSDYNIPKWFRDLLNNTYNWQKEIGETKLREFAKVILALQSKGIDVIVLKGVFLVPSVYCDAGVRGFHDLDILVKNECVQSTCEILRNELGYVQGEYDEKEDRVILCAQETIEERASELQHESEFIKVDRSHSVPIVFMVEVHRRLETVFDHTHLCVNHLFENKVAFNLFDVTAYRLSNEDMLTHLCYHNYWHTQSLQDVYEKRDILLRNYMDIRSFVKKIPIEWEKILSLKQNAKLWEAVSYSLYFAHLIFEDVLGEEINTQLDGHEIESEEKNIYDRWIVKRGKRRALGRYNTDFMDRLFSPNRFELAVSCCDFSGYSSEDVQTYFYFFMHSAKLYNMHGNENLELE